MKPAFPTAMNQTEGLTIRDYFAAKAMQGIVANPNAQGMSYREISDRAYTQADAMIKARDEQQAHA